MTICFFSRHGVHSYTEAGTCLSFAYALCNCFIFNLHSQECLCLCSLQCLTAHTKVFATVWAPVLYEKELAVFKCHYHQPVRICNRKHPFLCLFYVFELKRGLILLGLECYLHFFVSTFQKKQTINYQLSCHQIPFVHGMSLNCIFQFHNVSNRHY